MKHQEDFPDLEIEEVDENLAKDSMKLETSLEIEAKEMTNADLERAIAESKMHLETLQNEQEKRKKVGNLRRANDSRKPK